MTDACVLALSGTPGVGKTTLASCLKARGWNMLHVDDLARDLDCLDPIDPDDGASPVDIHRLADAWVAPEEGRWVVDGHLSHLLDLHGIVLLRCHPDAVASRLEARGYSSTKVQANVEWELVAGHWSELLEFEIDLPVKEFVTTSTEPEDLALEVEAWVKDGLPWEGLEAQAVGAVDWLNEPSP